MLTDLQLVNLVKNGHLEAYESLITKYKGKVYNIAFSFTSNFNESDDIAQNAFIKAYVNLDFFQGKSAFSTWLYRIAVNECFNGIKKRKKDHISFDAPAAKNGDITLKDILADRNADTEQILLSEEVQSLVRAALMELPDKYRMIITLRDIEDMPYEEIAQILKISMDKVKVWLFRARKKLKERLEKKGQHHEF